MVSLPSLLTVNYPPLLKWYTVLTSEQTKATKFMALEPLFVPLKYLSFHLAQKITNILVFPEILILYQTTCKIEPISSACKPS